MVQRWLPGVLRLLTELSMQSTLACSPAAAPGAVDEKGGGDGAVVRPSVALGAPYRSHVIAPLQACWMAVWAAGAVPSAGAGAQRSALAADVALSLEALPAACFEAAATQPHLWVVVRAALQRVGCSHILPPSKGADALPGYHSPLFLL